MELDYSEKSINHAMIDFTKKAKNDGRRGPFYNGKQDWVFEKNNERLFYNAVWQAYLDANRTMRGIKGTDKERGAFINLARKIQMFFLDNEAPLSHEDWCRGFIDDLKKYNDFDARYGHAQKVVNMAFKYLYCCKNADKNRFEECHMPLDQYTLAWFFMESGKLYQEWSWLDPDKYYRIEDEIKNILHNDILGKELVIWNEFKYRIINLKEQHH